MADDTFVIGHHLPLLASDDLPVASLVVRGAEPVLVGTGPPGSSAVFDVVDPGDVRWIFLSHQRPEHAGNVLGLLAACPRADVVTTWLTARRLAAHDLVLPEGRVRLVEEGAVLDTGDRALVVERPPLHVLPTTVGLLDTSTAVLWSAECWSAPFPDAPLVLDDARVAEWRDAFVRFHHWNSPWVHSLDPAWWRRAVDRIAERDLAVIVPAYGPALRGAHVPMAVEALRELPMLSPTPAGGPVPEPLGAICR